MNFLYERTRLFFAACLYYSGAIKLALWWQRGAGRRLIILNYHRAEGGDLRRQMLFLRRHYRIMHLEEALEEFYAPREKGKHVRDSRIPLVLTFDDGYRDNYTYGFVLARELGVPFTVFLIPGYVESGDYFWWLEGKRLVRRAKVKEVTLEGRHYHLWQAEERDALASAIDSCLRYAPSVRAREEFLGRMRELLAVPAVATREEEDTLPLTWEQVREMQDSGLVSFEAHTFHHPILAYLSDVGEVRQELGECRKVLEQQLGHAVRCLAYPVGKFEHFGHAGPLVAQEVGYAWAFTTVEEVCTPESDHYLLPRLAADVHFSWLILAAELAGFLGVLPRLRKKYERISK